MSIFNLGSINIDHVYRVPHLPGPGETVADSGYSRGLGGKGANQSLAAALAGAEVHHIGAVGDDGGWVRDRLAAAGVGVEHLLTVYGASGHAIVMVDDTAENQIVIHGGANRALTEAHIESALARARPGDWFLAQNETNMIAEGFAMARKAGMKTCYAAAPFDAETALALIDSIDLIAVNEIEAKQLAKALGVSMERLPVPEILMTLGTRGARLIGGRGRSQVMTPAYRVTPVDTTGAGDCFLGYFLAARDLGAEGGQALRLASAAAAIQVTRPGAGDAIPTAAEVDAFIKERHG